MKLGYKKFKSGGLHEKRAVATWCLGNHLRKSLEPSQQLLGTISAILSLQLDGIKHIQYGYYTVYVKHEIKIVKNSSGVCVCVFFLCLFLY